MHSSEREECYLGDKEVIGAVGVGAGVPGLAHVAPNLGEDPLRPPWMDLDLMPVPQSLPWSVHLCQ